MEETGVPGENHRPAASHWQTLSGIFGSDDFILCLAKINMSIKCYSNTLPGVLLIRHLYHFQEDKVMVYTCTPHQQRFNIMTYNLHSEDKIS